MSDNQLAVLTSGNMPSFAQRGHGEKLNQEAAAGTGGESINRISLKQSRFRLIVGGEQVSVIQEPHMDVVVVRANPGVSRAYYTKKYDPNAEDQTPDCFSSNGVVPDPDAPKPQCGNCADCPHSQWGSRINDMGNKVKACSEVKRIAIVPASNVEAPMFQIAVPAASLKVWGGYVRMLSQASPAIPYNGVVTRVSFDEESDFPKLKFEPKSWVTDEQYNTIQERFDSEEALRVATITQPVEREVRSSAQATQTAAPEQPPEPEPEPAPKPEPEPQTQSADPWATATQAAATAKEEKAETKQPEPEATAGADAFAEAGWGAAETKPETPPKQEHKESEANVVQGDDIDSIFGAGFDD